MTNDKGLFMNAEEIMQWSNCPDGSNRKTIVMNNGQQEILDTENHYGRPVLGKIIVFPMSAATQFTYDKPWAAISITDPEWVGQAHLLPQISEVNCVDLLRLGFDDAEFVRDSTILMTEEQARSVWEFAARVWDQVDLLMVHCHAGISRSTAIAQAISEVYQPDFADYFSQLWSPNQLVYNLMLNTR